MRPWAKLTELKAGDKVELDNGFVCIEAGIVEIKADNEGHLYFECSEGRHFLMGQLTFKGDSSLVGIYKDPV